MDVVSILGLGAIGLGFLLAFLTYRLLATERTNNRPIYVFQFFCFALVLVGAWLQFSSTAGSQEILVLQDEIMEHQEELVTYKETTTEIQEELQRTKNNLNAAQQKIEQVSQKLASSISVMQRISNVVPESIQNLEAVNAVLTGNSCSGGSAGVPLWGGRGTEMAALSTTVISNLSAAKSSIEGVLP